MAGPGLAILLIVTLTSQRHWTRPTQIPFRTGFVSYPICIGGARLLRTTYTRIVFRAQCVPRIYAVPAHPVVDLPTYSNPRTTADVFRTQATRIKVEYVFAVPP